MLLLLSLAAAGDTWTTVDDGVRQLDRTASGPLVITALEVDLCTDGLSLRATQEGERKQTVSAFAGDVGAIAAINGDFFSYDNYFPNGMAIGDGEHWQEDTTSEGFVAFGRDHAMISPQTDLWSDPASWMSEAVGGYPVVVQEGEAGVFGGGMPSHCDDRHPRTAVGLSEDRQTAWLVVVDGRSSASIGVTCEELGGILVDLGAWTALNLDGGGSSTLWTKKGVQNTPSDGSQRTVSNHLAILAGTGPAESCDWGVNEVVLQASALDEGSTDVDGDGYSDVCARSASELRCAVGPTLTTTIVGPALSDGSGWDDEDNYATLRFGDIDGDGRADACARANAGVRCWTSTGTGFSASITGPELSDDSGWSALRYWSTLRMGDVDGDGKEDLCARAAAGMRCWRSTGSGFDSSFSGPEWSDAAGWDQPEYFGSIRMGDVDGDGKEDLCGRGESGAVCALSTGSGFSSAFSGPAWRDEAGWDDPSAWGSLRLEDVDGDGDSDLCGRDPTKGWVCALWNGAAFDAEIQGPGLADASGWGDHSNGATVRTGDLDGDGDLDLCARANAGVRCWLYEDGAWSGSVEGPTWSDDVSWDHWRYYSTLRMADVDADGRADLCARAAAGVVCASSSGDGGFGSTFAGPAWSDETGWSKIQYYSTLRLGRTPPRSPRDSSADSGDQRGRATPPEECGCGGGGAGPLGAVLLLALSRRRR